MQLVVTFNDGAFSQFAYKLAALGAGGDAIMAQALNEGGHQIRQATIGAETAQTGLKRNVLERAQHEHEASAGSLQYRITSSGGNVGLKYFGAKETAGGVTAHPFGKEHFFAGAFITSGRAPNRKAVAKLNGQVYVSDAGGAWGGRIHKVKSGVIIPVEMTKGQTAAAFEAGADRVLNAVVVKLGSLLN